MKRKFCKNRLIRNCSIFFLICLVACSPKSKTGDDGITTEETRFEIQPLMNEISDSMKFAADMMVSSSIEAFSPAAMTAYEHEKSSLIMVTQNQLILAGVKDANKAYSPIVYESGSGQLSEHKGALNIGLSGILENQKGICQSQWGSVIIAPIYPIKGNQKGNLREWNLNTKKANPIVNLGKGNFTAVATFVDNAGTNAIYYADQSVANSFLYKYVFANNQSFDSGKLYVANFEHGYWILLDVRTNTVISPKYKTQQAIQENLHAAAVMAGAATMLPISDLAVDPNTRQLVFAVMPDENRRALFGGIYSLGEEDGRCDAVVFHTEPLLLCSTEHKFSHPQNFTFDSNGNLWIVNRLTDTDIDNPSYTTFSRNGLIVLPRRGPQTGLTFLVAAAGRENAFSGIAISADRKAMFLGLHSKNKKGKLLYLKGDLIEKLGN